MSTINVIVISCMNTFILVCGKDSVFVGIFKEPGRIKINFIYLVIGESLAIDLRVRNSFECI